MCGRFNLRTNPATLVQMFLPQMDVKDVPPLPPRYNIAPTQQVLAVTGDNAKQRSLRFFRWGLVPPWADSLWIGARMINARSETITEKRSFRGPFASRRCLIPASGYYEWLTLEKGRKQPIHIHRGDDGLLAMAGLLGKRRRRCLVGPRLDQQTVAGFVPPACGGSLGMHAGQPESESRRL